MEESTTDRPAAGFGAGSQFGHYQLLRLLGTGGYGEVYEAEDTRMHRTVALKLIAAPYAGNPVFRERLYREARTAGRLNEPHVVPIHQCGEIDGQLYIDMRLIEGTDLLNELKRHGHLNPARAVAIVRQVAAALDAAHDGQVTHRDVKPANILLTGDDFACLVDFGLANAAADAKLTSTGITIGTFAYMAPERLRNADVGPGADVYALACVLYECLTGSQPYTDSDLPALITSHLTAPIPRPTQQRPEIPAGFDDVIARGMAKNPLDRYPSAGALADAAQRVLTTADQVAADTVVAVTPAPGPPPDLSETVAIRTQRYRTTTPAGIEPPAPKVPFLRRHRRVAIALASVAALVLVAALTTVVVGRQSRQQPESGADEARPPQVELPFGELTIPDGIAVDKAGNVYVTDDGTNRVLRLAARANAPTELPFTGVTDPDGLTVDDNDNVYLADGGLDGSPKVLKLLAGSNTQVKVPLTGLTNPWDVAVDTKDNVYVSDGVNRVLMLEAGSNNQVKVPFTGLNGPYGVTVDNIGSVYVTDGGNDRVLKLAAGSNNQVELPFTDLDVPKGVAVDTNGNVYITDSRNNRVLKLPVGSSTQIELPFTGLNGPEAVAVDTNGNVYVADIDNHRVLKLPAD
ncbi:protein kinase [Mycobacterium spongiae]|uniref:non-specific serine/threonine protein kinase n=1 Tax=Mycobacterium spongiae TaxID=886343 RepID=A0A975K1Q7_9MYCO|nr:protein kinase [Mycobacterium spongiae]